MTQEKISWNDYRQRPEVIARVERIAKSILETDQSGIGSMESAKARAWDAVRHTFSYEYGVPDEMKLKPKGPSTKKLMEAGAEEEITDFDAIFKAAERGDIPGDEDLNKGKVTFDAPSKKPKLWLPPSAR